MGDNWDDEDDFEPNLDSLDAKLGGGVAETWEDEEDELEVQTEVKAAIPSQNTLNNKQRALEQAAATLGNQVKYALEEDETSEDRKARERRQVEEADHELSADLFGGKVASKKSSLGGAGSLAAIPLKTKADHSNFGVTISKKMADSTPLSMCAFMKALLDRLPESMTTDSLDNILEVLNKHREAKKEKEGEKAKAVKKVSKKETKAKDKRHHDVFGSADYGDSYDAQYGGMEDDFM